MFKKFKFGEGRKASVPEITSDQRAETTFQRSPYNLERKGCNMDMLLFNTRLFADYQVLVVEDEKDANYFASPST